jgi:GT2 family glycosyltransferase
MSRARITVLIATADRADLLADCLAHVARAAAPTDEIIVLDQSRGAVAPLKLPSDGARPALRHLRCPRRGKSAALNIGVAEASGDLLAFTDDDCRVAPDWLEVMHQAHAQSGGGAALTGRVLAGATEPGAVIAPSLRNDPEAREYRSPLYRDVLFGNNMALPAAALRRVGPFDEALGPGTRYPAAEDNDLGYRLLKAGIPIRYLPGLIVRHRSWRGAAQQVDLYRAYGVGQGAFYGKHARAGDWHMLGRMAKNLWDGCRDASGAAILGRGYDFRASVSFSKGLLRGFLGTALGAGNSPATALRAEP